MSNYIATRDGGKSSEEGLMKPWLRLFSSGVPVSNNALSLKATQRGAGANMSVDIAIGDAGIALAGYMYWAWTDAINNVIIAGADPTNPRVDAVVAYVDLSVVSSASYNNPGALKFVAVAGTPAVTPAIPPDATIQTAIGAGNPFVKICSVAVAALASNIVNANITDLRTDISYRGTVAASNYTSLNQVPTTITALGNHSYSLVFNGVDLTGTVSNGMRLKGTRTAAGTMCASLNGTTQYFSNATPAGMTFTNNFIVSAWVKLTSYATYGVVASRYNGTSGWALGINTSGQIELAGFNASVANKSSLLSYQSVPLNKWVHITGQLDMLTFTATTTTSYVMIDGVDVPITVSRSGTNPTTLVQAGNLEIGSQNGGLLPFVGKIAQVAIYNAKVTQATILASMNQTLTGSEASLISAYTLSNSITDLNVTNANNLTANGSVTTTTVDAPWTQDDTRTPNGTTDYGIITSKTFSTNTTITVQTPEGSLIPTTGGWTALSYSSQKAPYGFPTDKGRWQLVCFIYSQTSTSGTTPSTLYTFGGLNLNVPIGVWDLEYQVDVLITPNASYPNAFVGLSLSTSAQTLPELTARTVMQQTSTNNQAWFNVTRSHPINIASATPYYLLGRQENPFTLFAIGATAGSSASESGNIKATCAYL